MSHPLRGELFWVRLEPVEGTEMGKTRPCAVVSNDIGNRYSSQVMVAPVSSQIARIYPYEVFVAKGRTGLNEDGKVLLDQIRSIDKSRLGDKLGALTPEVLKRIDLALHISLGLRCVGKIR